MKVNYKDCKKEQLGEGVYRIWLIDEKAGANNFFMRLFEIYPLKNTARDKHPYEHEIFIVEGKGVVEIGEEKIAVHQGDAVFIPPNKMHAIKNMSDKDILRFICIVPASYRSFKKG